MGPQVLIADDITRAPLRPAFLRNLALALYARTIRRRATACGPDAVVVATRALIKQPLPGAELVEPSHVIIGGAASCDERALAAFGAHGAAKLSASLSGSQDEGLGELVEMRLFIAPLLEYLVRPAEAMADFFSRRKPAGVRALSGEPSLEKIALAVAGTAGIPVHPSPSFSLWRPLLRLRHTFWSKARFLPRPAEIEEHWRNFAVGSQARAEVVIFAEEERRLRRAKVIAEALRARGRSVKVVSVPFKKDARVCIEEMQENGIDTAFLNVFMPAQERERISKTHSAIERKAWSDLSQDSAVATFRYRGVPIWSIYRGYLRNSWPTYAIAGMFAKAAAENLMTTCRPSQLIVMETGLYSKALLTAAKNYGVTSYWYSNNPILYTIQFWLPVMLRIFRADKVIATGEFMREQLIERGFYSPGDIITSGDVILPALSADKSAAEKLRRELGVKPGQKVVLCLSSYLSPDVSAEKLRLFHQESFELARKSGSALWIKAHPGQNPQTLKADLAQWGVQFEGFFHTESLMELLAASDLAIMMFSQAGAEVLMAGVPLVILQEEAMVEQFDAQFPYAKEGAALLLLMGAENNFKFHDLLTNPASQSALRERAGSFLNRFVSVRHPNNAAYLAEQMSL